MEEKGKDLYATAHLFVSAIRVVEHQMNAPPTIDDISKVLVMSIERSSYVCRKLQELGVIDSVKGSYGNRLFVRDHLKIEEIPRDADGTQMEAELQKFKESQKALTQKIENLQAKQAQKKKDLFAEMEKKLKQELDKKS
jgi:DNA-binding transcriptional regulator GbsR (MarR family)